MITAYLSFYDFKGVVINNFIVKFTRIGINYLNTRKRVFATYEFALTTCMLDANIFSVNIKFDGENKIHGYSYYNIDLAYYMKTIHTSLRFRLISVMMVITLSMKKKMKMPMRAVSPLNTFICSSVSPPPEAGSSSPCSSWPPASALKNKYMKERLHQWYCSKYCYNIIVLTMAKM